MKTLNTSRAGSVDSIFIASGWAIQDISALVGAAERIRIVAEVERRLSAIEKLEAVVAVQSAFAGKLTKS